MLKNKRQVLISPSMMCADFLHLEDEIALFEKYNLPLLHIDIMDGHYVPNFTLGPDFCRKLAARTQIPLDIHLMIENVDSYIPVFAESESPYICIHPEVSYHPLRSLSLLKSVGARPGIAVDPGIPLDHYKHMFDQVDMVLIMTVNPGYSGQKLIPSMLDKIQELRDYRDQNNLDFLIEVDGNVSWENIPKMIRSGADVLVAGTSSIFSSDMGREKGLEKMNMLIEETISGSDRGG